MTSTPVRDAGSALTNLTAVQGRSTMNTGAFQKVWSSQMSMGSQSSQAWGNTADTIRTQDASVRQSTAKENVGKTESASKPDKANAAENGNVQGDGQQTAENVQQTTEDTQQTAGDVQTVEKAQDGESAGQTERTENGEDTKTVESIGSAEADGLQEEVQKPEELVQVMEVLGSAALGMVQQIADAFGVSVEEVHSAMEELGMEPLDVLNAGALGGLVLKLGGAEDSYALITDESLYDNYRMLMGQLDSVQQESAQTLDIAPEEMSGLLKKLSEFRTDVPAETITPTEHMEKEASREEGASFREVEMQAVVPTVEDTVQEEQDAQGQTGGQTQGNSGQRRSEAGQTADKPERGQQFNLFAQDFRTGFQPEIAQTEQMPRGSMWSADTRNIMNQIMDFMKLQLNADTTSLEMQLHPASLGTLQVQIDSKGGMMTAHFITQNESVKAALESQIVQLQESFEQQGIKVEAIEVTVQTHEFEQNLEQGRERDSQEPGKKNRTRKINLNDSPAVEDMEEEDALAADLMAARGGTVDYTV